MLYRYDKFYTPKSDGSCVQAERKKKSAHLQTNILKSYTKRVPYSSDSADHMIAMLVLCMTEE